MSVKNFLRTWDYASKIFDLQETNIKTLLQNSMYLQWGKLSAIIWYSFFYYWIYPLIFAIWIYNSVSCFILNWKWLISQSIIWASTYIFTVEAKHLFSCVENLWMMMLLFVPLAFIASLNQYYNQYYNQYHSTSGFHCFGHNYPSILYFYHHCWVPLWEYSPITTGPHINYGLFFNPLVALPPLLPAHTQALEPVSQPDLIFHLDLTLSGYQSFIILDSPHWFHWFIWLSTPSAIPMLSTIPPLYAVLILIQSDLIPIQINT